MKRLLVITGLLFLFAPQAKATWTIHVSNGGTCSASPCSVTPSPAVTAGDLLVVKLVNNNTGATITAVTAGACTPAWVISAATSFSAVATGSGEMGYCLNAVGGSAAIAVTSGVSCGSNCTVTIDDWTSSRGSIALDSGATPAGTLPDATCTSCAGVGLSLSSNNKAISVMAGCGNTCTGLTGTGFTGDNFVLGDAAGHGINIVTSGTVTSPATWTQGSSTLNASAIAFQEAPAGGGGGSGLGGKSGVGGKSGL